MSHAPRKPFWKRKRWIAAAVLWLVIAYPMSVGPASYCHLRGWIPGPIDSTLEILYRPLSMLPDPLAPAMNEYASWWHRLANHY